MDLKTVLIALQDVENALVAYAKEQTRRQTLTDAVAANRRAVDLANRLYTQGMTNFLNVLEAERSLYTTEDALVQSQRNISLDLVALYKALGGGWEGPEGPKSGPTDYPISTPTQSRQLTDQQPDVTVEQP